MATTNITMKIDESVKTQLVDLLENLGLDLSTFFTMTAKQAIREQALPFTPNMEEYYFGPKAYDRAMKNATYVNGEVVISKNDEWAKETEWDDLYEELAKERGIDVAKG